jgi:AraC family transcriptional regulator of adaptative response / DNA-3-methyladenine glycosylase II
VPGAWDGFELAVRAIFGQQITVPAATKLLGKLVEAHGVLLPEEMRGTDGLTHVFPSPPRLVGIDLGLGMPCARAQAVTSLAKALAADPAIFSPGASLEAAITKLRALPGIGEWTAQYIAMRELREPDAFPAADIGLMRAMTDADRRRPTPAELLALAERWRPWRAYAALHLWASGMAHPVATVKVRHEREAA